MKILLSRNQEHYKFNQMKLNLNVFSAIRFLYSESGETSVVVN